MHGLIRMQQQTAPPTWHGHAWSRRAGTFQNCVCTSSMCVMCRWAWEWWSTSSSRASWWARCPSRSARASSPCCRWGATCCIHVHACASLLPAACLVELPPPPSLWEQAGKGSREGPAAVRVHGASLRRRCAAPQHMQGMWATQPPSLVPPPHPRMNQAEIRAHSHSHAMVNVVRHAVCGMPPTRPGLTRP